MERVSFSDGIRTAYLRVESAPDRAAAYSVEVSRRDRGGTPEELQMLFEEHPELQASAKLAGSVVGALVNRNYGEREFYARLSDFVFGGDLLTSEEERVTAFALTLADARFPYHHFRTTTMTDETYAELSREHNALVERVQQVALRSFLQKTEEASAVLEVLDCLDDDPARCVVLAHYVDCVRTAAGQVV